ncbi:MAG: dihydrolipoyl dehydrogenase [Ruminococcaceae bacterium]|nr:dihydrolipoyl dehydrogenase [Oscillospiraceae bacterium]
MFELIIIGGGPAGYNAAERAAAGGLSTLVIEERALGGVCLNEGCIPTKTLLYSAKIFDYAKHSEEYGVKLPNASIDHAAVVARKDKVVKQLVGGIGMKMKHGGVKVVNAHAEITGRNGEAFTVKAGDEVYEGRRLLICTGSSAAVPPIPGLREGVASGFVKTNREILDMTTVPEKLAVIGGGVIGMEMASYFNSIGSKVTVIEMMDHIGGPTDGEIAAILLKNYKKKGIEFMLGAKVTGVGTYSVTCEYEGKTVEVSADCVLCAVGRRANTAGLGLESIGVLTERGAIVTNECGRTNIGGVWAAGDVNGKSMLAHTAYREGEAAVNDMLGKKDKVNYDAIPAVIYTNPEVASVGETSETIKAKGIEADTQSFTLRYSGRYVAENEGGDGIVKIIVDKAHRRVLGVSMIGSYASEIIYGAAMMVENEMRVEDVRKFVFPHPTVCEVIREGMFGM